MFTARLFAALLGVVILITLDVAAYTYGGAPLAVTITTAGVFSLAGWLATTRRRPTRSTSAFNLYVATVVALLALYAEQWSGGFSSSVVRLFPRSFPAGIGLSDHAFVGVFALAGSALLLLGALAYYHGTAFGRFAAWFTFAWGVVAALAVYVYPLFSADGLLALPGTFTAPLPLVVSLFGVRALLRADARPVAPQLVPSRVVRGPASIGGVGRGER